MSFSPEQIAELKAPLSSANVKKNPRGFDYVEAYHAENEANRIFGFSEWDRLTELTYLDTKEVDGKYRVYYRAKVRIVVRSGDGGETIREGNGFGSGIDRDLGSAHESALKEAESDAEKRALKTFGNPFGQALYDKTKSEVADPLPELALGAKLAIDGLKACASAAEFKATWEKNKEGWKKVLNGPDYAAVVAVMQSEAKRWTPKEEANPFPAEAA